MATPLLNEEHGRVGSFAQNGQLSKRFLTVITIESSDGRSRRGLNWPIDWSVGIYIVHIFTLSSFSTLTYVVTHQCFVIEYLALN